MRRRYTLAEHLTYVCIDIDMSLADKWCKQCCPCDCLIGIANDAEGISRLL